MTTLHNMSLGVRRRHVTRSADLAGRTGVHVTDLSRQRLRKQVVQAPVRRSEPFYSGYAMPARFEGIEILDLAIELEWFSAGEVEPRPHRLRVYS